MTTNATTYQFPQSQNSWIATLIRVIWVILAIANIFPVVRNFWPYYSSLANLQPAGVFSDWPAADLQTAVSSTGITPSLVAGLITGLVVIMSFIFWGAAFILFWFKQDDWMSLFTAYTFVAIIGYSFAGLIDHGQFPYFIQQTYELIFALTWPTFITFLYLFPSGFFAPSWSKWLAVFAYLFAIFHYHYMAQNVEAPTYVAITWFLLVASGVYSQVYRYRNQSNATQKQQTKWFLYALAVWFVINLLTNVLLIVALLLGADLANGYSPTNFVFILINEPISLISINLIPLSILLALLRYRLWDVDFLINRSIVYIALSGVLFLVFGFTVYAVSTVLQGMLGGAATLALSAGILGAVFQPTRRRLQRFVDRRLYHIYIDYKRPTPKLEFGQVVRGTDFGHYSNLTLIGKGGMSMVYRAHHPTISQEVALKVLPSELREKGDYQQRFLREAQLVSDLQHPNIVRVFDYGENAGTCYMVMEYVSGQDLHSYLQEKKRLSLPETIFLLRQIAAGLEYAHERGLVHRDIKPANIMLNFLTQTTNRPDLDWVYYRAIIMDFGIAKKIGSHTLNTQAGGLMGTFDYISPEQIQAATDINHQADIYTLGVMTYQLLTGELPFRQQNPGALLIAHLNQPAPNPCDVMPNLPKQVGQAVVKAMAKEPKDRFETVQKFISALTE